MGVDGTKTADDLIAGAIAGAFSRTMIAPLDVIKIRFQIQSDTGGAYRYGSVWSAFRTIYRHEGITAFWKGNTPAMLMVVPYSAIQFATYQGLKMSKFFKKESVVSSLAMGGLAGLSATLWTYPLDLLRTRLAAQREPKTYRGLFDAARVIARQEGVRGFYAGLTPTIVEIVPYIAFIFGTYETAKTAWMKRRGTSTLSPFESTAIGCVTGTISKLVVLPLDTVKKRMQVENQFGQHSYDGIWHACKSIVQREGVPGLFRGSVPSLLKAAPYTGVTFAAFEYTKRKLKEFHSKSKVDKVKF